MENPIAQGSTQLEAKAKSGASWFYWIAGLSLINSAITLFGSDWGFIAGLGITQVVDAVVGEAAPDATWIAFIPNLIIAGLCVWVGYLAHRSGKVFLTGMILYGLDSLLFLMVQDWIGVGFHALVLYFLFTGFRARQELDRVTPGQETQIPRAA